MKQPREYHQLHNRPPGDEPGAADRVLASLGLPPAVVPRWAILSLRRGEQVEGKWVDARLRWSFTCVKCLKDVFLIHPYIPPALEEVSLDGHIDGYSLTPTNDVRLHPCPVEWVTVGWDGLEVLNLDDFGGS